MTVSNRPQRIQSDADQMINTLFVEIETILEPENCFAYDRKKRKNGYFSLRKTQISQTTISGYWSEATPTSLSDQSPEPLIKSGVQDLETASPVGETVEEETDIYSPPLWLKSLDKIIFSSSCSVFMVALLFLQKEQQLLGLNLQQLSPFVTVKEDNKTSIESVNTDPEFIGYMERVLTKIDRDQKLAEKLQAEKEKQQQKPEVEPEPTQIIATATPQPSKSTQKETTQPVSSLPSLPPPPPPKIESETPNPPQAEKPSPSPKPTPETPEEKPNPKPQTPEKETNTVAETPAYTLVGLLELGEHSAALLNRQGTTQRVMLEETLPGSNWMLVSVVNQKATFVKDNQQKSMYVGEELLID